MAYKDINTKKEYNKKYREKNKEYFKEYYKNWYQKNKDRKKIKVKEYQQNNIEKIKKRKRKHYLKNKYDINKKCREYSKKRRKKSLRCWEGYIPTITNCQICNKKIYFNQSNRTKAICFDHKKNVLIKCNPTHWLRLHKRIPENQKIWDSCDFGMLCGKCNVRLPAKNREEFLRNAVKYVFGNNAIIIY